MRNHNFEVHNQTLKTNCRYDNKNRKCFNISNNKNIFKMLQLMIKNYKFTLFKFEPEANGKSIPSGAINVPMG